MDSTRLPSWLDLARRRHPDVLRSAARIDQAEAQRPLLFLKERGRLAIADRRLDQQRLEQSRVQRDVELDVRQAVFDLSNDLAVIELQRAAVRQARQLLAGEQHRFETANRSSSS